MLWKPEPMVSLATTLKPLSPLSSFVKQHKTSNNNAFSTYCTYTYTNSGLFKREGAVPQKKYTFVGVHDASDQVESSWTIPLSEVVVVRKKKAFWQRSWNYWDVIRLVQFAGVHLLSLIGSILLQLVSFSCFLLDRCHQWDLYHLVLSSESISPKFWSTEMARVSICLWWPSGFSGLTFIYSEDDYLIWTLYVLKEAQMFKVIICKLCAGRPNRVGEQPSVPS